MGLAAGIGHTYWHFAQPKDPQIIPFLLRKIFAVFLVLDFIPNTMFKVMQKWEIIFSTKPINQKMITFA